MVEREEARKLLWAHEHRKAFEQANLEAHLQFNRCPSCGKWVCDDCFCIEVEKGRVCSDCCYKEDNCEIKH